MMAELDALLAERLDGDELLPGSIPGTVAMIARGGEVLHHVAVGDAVRYADADGTLAAERMPMCLDTIFDVASLTKLFTAATALRAVEDGYLGLDTPVADAVPTLNGMNGRPDVTLRHLLIHTSGLPAVRRLWTVPGDRVARADAVLATASEAAAGARHVYSCVGYLITGVLLERALGAPLPALVEQFITGPLGLTDTGFAPSPAVHHRIAATEDSAHVGRGVVRGEVHDEASWSLGGTGGNAGLFSTAADLLRFAEMLRAGGVDPRTGARVLSAESVAAMTTDQLPAGMAADVGYGQGIGPRIADRTFTGSLTSDRAYGHTGFTGTSLVVDPDHELVVILLANAVHPVRGRTMMGELRSAVADAAVVRAALTHQS
jgi:CubicO group peptidase (beta-lactamase class C family)